MPFYTSLSIEEIMKFAGDYQSLAVYLPEERDQKKLNRQNVIDIINTIVKTPFKNWVDERIKERNEKIKESQNLNLELNTDIALAFKRSMNVSSKSMRE